jgi:hypothetical protein
MSVGETRVKSSSRRSDLHRPPQENPGILPGGRLAPVGCNMMCYASQALCLAEMPQLPDQSQICRAGVLRY